MNVGNINRKIGFIILNENKEEYSMISILNNINMDNYFIKAEANMISENIIPIQGTIFRLTYLDFFNNKFYLKGLLIRNCQH